jgi:hypothetical protein
MVWPLPRASRKRRPHLTTRDRADIPVDDEVLERLKELAEPFAEPTPNEVLWRVMGLEGKGPELPPAPTKAHRAPLGTLIPEEDYWQPILEELAERGGRAPPARSSTRSAIGSATS